MNFFSKQPTVQEQSKKWISDIKHNMRDIDRDINNINKEQSKLKASIKKIAKSNSNPGAIKTLAKSLVKSNKTKEQLQCAKTHLNSTILTIKQQLLSTVNIANNLKQNTEIMKKMNAMYNIPAVNKLAAQMSQEMVKSNVIQEMVADTMEDMDLSQDIESESEIEINKVIDDIVSNKFTNVSKINNKELVDDSKEVEEEEDNEVEEMKKRLEALNG